MSKRTLTAELRHIRSQTSCVRQAVSAATAALATILLACADAATSPTKVAFTSADPANDGALPPPNGLVWTTVPSPNRGTLANELKDLAILSATDIWAVGEWNPGVPPTATGRRTLVEHWNGSSWQLVTSPNASWTGVDLSTLEAVAPVSSNSIWAVGHANDFGSFKSTTLIVRWDGIQWNIVPSPNPAGASMPNELHGLAVVSQNDIWAVGFQGSPRKSLILHWNGSSWSNFPNSCGVALYAVKAISASNIWAVGEGTTCKFNGQSWTKIPSEEYADFYGVAAVSATDVWAVGRTYYCTYACTSVSHIERWNGSKWSEVSHATGSQWSGIVAIAANNVWVVGDNSTWGISERWNGTAWTQVAVPNAGSGSALNAVKATGTGQLWAVGRFFTSSGIPRTWTLRR